jgi:hypothetical protein
MSQAYGVEYSFTNQSGTLILLTLRPGVDPGRVTEGVRQVLSEQGRDHVPVPVEESKADKAVQREQWEDQNGAVTFAAPETPAAPPTEGGTPWILLLVLAALVLAILWWRHRLHGHEEHQRPR